MAAPLENLRAIRDELIARDWVITCFPFTYKQHRYFTLVQRYVPPEVVPPHQLVKLTFVDSANTNRTFSTPANTRGIQAGAKEIRTFFGIEFRPNLGEILRQFCEQLGRAISPTFPATLAPEEKAATLIYLDKCSGEDPNRIFCFDVRRNGDRTDGTPQRRSPFNSQKTEMLRPVLFKVLKGDENLSFFYSVNSVDERSDADILERFYRRESRS